MKSIRLSCLLVGLLFAFSATANDVDNGYSIDHWKYEALVHEDGTWDVTETLRVVFNEERHGIYRYIPRLFVRHHDMNGHDAKFTYRTRIDSVRANATLSLSSLEDSQKNLVLKLGHEDSLLRGERTYVIKYRLVYPDDRYTAGDEIYHTVFGADCNTRVGTFDFSLRFDKALPEVFAHTLRVYSGEWGTADNELAVAARLADNTVSGHVEDIPPFRAITLGGQLPEGYWQGASRVSPLLCYLFMAASLFFFCAVMGYLLFHRRKRPVTVIEYNAPEGMSSAEVGVVIDGNADLSDLTSLIVWFASKGYLKIKEGTVKKRLFSKDENDIELQKLSDLPSDAPKYQTLFWKVLFGDGDKVALSELGDKHTGIAAALRALQKHFRGKRSLTRLHWPSLIAALCFLASGVAAIITSGTVSTWGESCLWVFSLFIWAAPLLLVGLLRIVISDYDMISKTWHRLMQYLTIVVLGVADVFCYHALCYSPYDTLMPGWVMYSLVGAGWLIALFSGRMERDSRYRQEMMSLLLGFREFIDKAEMPMLKAQVDEDPAYFYNVLPYAMVFGLTKKWQKQFKDIDTPAPDWYECHEAQQGITSYMLSQRLVHNMSTSVKNAMEVSSHAPDGVGSIGSSPGGFSGGFSGGGGGGGGVGSW